MVKAITASGELRHPTTLRAGIISTPAANPDGWTRSTMTVL